MASSSTIEAATEREMHVVAAIEEWNRGLPPGAQRKKYEKLGESPANFFDGTNHLFWADFSGDDRLAKFGNEATATWICGDCHVSSFSATGSDSDGPMYGLNEFDEAVIADYQYDVWRMAISVVLTASSNGGECATEGVLKAAVQAFARSYLRSVLGYKHEEGGQKQRGAVEGRAPPLSMLLASMGGNVKGRLLRFLAIVEREYSRKKMLKKWCSEEGLKHKFLPLKDVLQPSPKLEADSVATAFGYYAETAEGGEGVNVKDVARRLQGSVASSGLPRFSVLTEAWDGELHILDVKLQQKPTAYHFMRPEERWEYRRRFVNDGERHSQACRLLSSSRDPHNGWIELKEDIHPSVAGFYSVRQVSPYEEEYPTLDTLDVKAKFRGFTLNSEEAFVELCEDWARILATQHSRAACLLDPDNTGDRRSLLGREIGMLAKQNKTGFEDLIWNIASSYSIQVTLDWLAFRRHLFSGL